MTDSQREDSKSALAERRGVDPDVYQPAEDSGLLAEAAIESLSEPELVLEVGTGSGWVAEQVDAETGARVIGSDLNPYACRQAQNRGIEAIQANLVAPFADGVFDAVLFNPPYLPTDPDNKWDDWMEHALSGGEDGRRLIVPFLKDVSRVLAPGGEVYLLVSSLTGYDIVVELAEEAGFSVDDIRQESYPFETLSILKLTAK
ncbi:release factor glutamine methyltransferase [Halohasta litchfieldiae]|jgi:release factor glutamine methyltransferase|uniref:Release factor glutamine methyltransferase n=1 Tax=Halohasta litchfieldiae TaxID=1073996 RepID=A0A1H6T8P0_9EURY|nr:HemK2/MTQ2 family protein methyltransferase [Halohasta litchfieldiae]ATW87002.1 release factor glutamine methyltransferase [Halohasta litchfieldiae]SEI72182.1 release factor glutamine methyltransferase [Halohasta litchfieldiae]